MIQSELKEALLPRAVANAALGAVASYGLPRGSRRGPGDSQSKGDVVRYLAQGMKDHLLKQEMKRRTEEQVESTAKGMAQGFLAKGVAALAAMKATQQLKE